MIAEHRIWWNGWPKLVELRLDYSNRAVETETARSTDRPARRASRSAPERGRRGGGKNPSRAVDVAPAVRSPSASSTSTSKPTWPPNPRVTDRPNGSSSYHDFSGTPDDLEGIAGAEVAGEDADIVKIANHGQHDFADNVRMNPIGRKSKIPTDRNLHGANSVDDANSVQPGRIPRSHYATFSTDKNSPPDNLIGKEMEQVSTITKSIDKDSRTVRCDRRPGRPLPQAR